MNIDWRIWLWERLRASTSLLDMLGNGEFSIYGAGSLTGPPDEKPFVVIHIGETFPVFKGVSGNDTTIYAHDDPGTYTTVDTILDKVRDVLCGVGETTGHIVGPPSGGIAVKWGSNGPDQSDDDLHTIMRDAKYQLFGKDGNA